MIAKLLDKVVAEGEEGIMVNLMQDMSAKGPKLY